MKIKKLLHFVWVLVVGQLLFSCSSSEYYRFAPSKAEAYNKAEAKPAPEAKVATVTMVEETAPAAQVAVATPAPALEASAAKASPVLAEKKHFATTQAAAPVPAKAEIAASTITEAEAVAMVKARVASMSKAEKAFLANEVKEVMRAGQAVNIIEVIFAILIPPLGVFLHEGELNTRFWVSVLLTLLFVIPGIIYALLVVTDSI
ncbi:YqaE/Pmp3 family membrane protein [Rufibacter sp. DG15C]|uniref:YqaE/Pmp3 family membrane protein n=1 Tax=Rufibacter sp. DG15C TaxID=1379909 RepID=UPI000A5FFBBE|nr:YqaE/Pmp3 family membrane protein [Rufibacter sp. DG15C]